MVNFTELVVQLIGYHCLNYQQNKIYYQNKQKSKDMFQKIKRYFENRKFIKSFNKHQYIKKRLGDIDVFHTLEQNLSIIRVKTLSCVNEIKQQHDVKGGHTLFTLDFNVYEFSHSLDIAKNFIDDHEHKVDITTKENFLEMVKQHIQWSVVQSLEHFLKDIVGSLFPSPSHIVEGTFLKNRRKKNLYLLQGTYPRTIEDPANVEIFVEGSSISVSTKNAKGYIRFNPDDKFQIAHHDWLDNMPNFDRNLHNVLDGQNEPNRNIHYKEFVEQVANQITENIFNRIVSENLLPLTENQKSYVKR